MKRNAGGFTLIELIVVIVVLGILAATAMPKFLDVKDDAGLAAAQGIAGGLASATATNYAAKVMNKAGSVTVSSATAATVCNAAISTLIGAALPDGWQLDSAGSSSSCSTNGSAACNIQNVATTTYSAVATITCVN